VGEAAGVCAVWFGKGAGVTSRVRVGGVRETTEMRRGHGAHGAHGAHGERGTRGGRGAPGQSGAQGERGGQGERGEPRRLPGVTGGACAVRSREGVRIRRSAGVWL